MVGFGRVRTSSDEFGVVFGVVSGIVFARLLLDFRRYSGELCSELFLVGSERVRTSSDEFGVGFGWLRTSSDEFG